ncbi:MULTISPECIES: hypothetical protein [unclassified Chryseobacterium]|uniref:hypothetical protein n=1 Tax=unclassified Chryseobacterium TaxID=2593645 RepID=UPI0028531841|nr:hypothetical protein [Chryseobacterium sp. CFS7]MDR4892232.1 hypothetical protein [Chryseobacterium sp. CFS7]
MKTLKLIILGVAATVLLHSCSNDRDDEARQKAIEEVKNSNQKIKLNKSEFQSRNGETQTANDTIIIRSGNSILSEDPITNSDPLDGGDPTTITPPKR